MGSRGLGRGACFSCEKFGHIVAQCPQRSHQTGSQRPAASDPIVGDAGRSHRVFVAVDDSQADHQGTVIEAAGVLCGIPISVLFDFGALDSFISSSIVE